MSCVTLTLAWLQATTVLAGTDRAIPELHSSFSDQQGTDISTHCVSDTNFLTASGAERFLTKRLAELAEPYMLETTVHPASDLASPTADGSHLWLCSDLDLTSNNP